MSWEAIISAVVAAFVSIFGTLSAFWLKNRAEKKTENQSDYAYLFAQSKATIEDLREQGRKSVDELREDLAVIRAELKKYERLYSVCRARCVELDDQCDELKRRVSYLESTMPVKEEPAP